MERQADFSGFLGETFALLSDCAKGWLAFVAVVGGMGAAGVLLGFAQIDDQLLGIQSSFGFSTEHGLGIAAFQLIVAVVSIIATYFLLAHYLEARGRLIDRSTRIWAYIGITILSFFGFVFGLLFFIIPGIILMIRWSTSSGFLIGERRGIVESLGASWDATSGHSWSIFGAALVLLVTMVVIGGIMGGAAGATGSFTAIGVVSSFAEAIGNAVFLAFGIAVFVLVSDNTNQVSEVFE